MKRFLLLALCLLPLTGVTSCGYHAGGLVNPRMQGVSTFAVNMFDNVTTYPELGQLVTSAVGNELQSDGTFKMAAPSSADVVIRGSVTSASLSRTLVDWQDTNLSRELRVRVHVSYEVIRRSTGEVIRKGRATGDGTYFNTGGNTLTGRSAALSYGARQAASAIVDQLTIP